MRTNSGIKIRDINFCYLGITMSEDNGCTAGIKKLKTHVCK